MIVCEFLIDVLIVFVFFLVFSRFFDGFSLDFYKGRISKNTLQISLTPPKNPSLVDFLCVDPTGTLDGC